MAGSRKENDLSEENNKENVDDTVSRSVSVKKGEDKENVLPPETSSASAETKKQDRALKSRSMKGGSGFPSEVTNFKSFSTGGGRTALKQTSLQVCMQLNSEVDKGMKTWTSVDSEHSSSLKVWEFSDSEAAPASSWSSLPNRALLCKTLPLDVGRCTCLIVKEQSPEGLRDGSVYSLYTHEGRGRKDRKLAVAYHRRRNGKSVFRVAQNVKGLLCSSDESYVGSMTANLMGSKYYIWDKGVRVGSVGKVVKPLLSVVIFTPTITTWTGSYRRMRALLPKQQPVQKNNNKQVPPVSKLPLDWLENKDQVQKLCSRIPHYNKMSKQHELDFRDRGRTSLKIQSSVKNFQLTLTENPRQTILQMGRVDKAKFVIDFRYPFSGYQAFCICLASIDSKLCCTV
ncbi:Tubby-like protein 8 [Raphanus sativus]|uniref:Tubby-like protein 8 n=1 Tax=Raphanus sativus TaxID=3726 RepID=A0A6J0JJF4_RAPSA|nr:tubby-like protein 8 [Raphanus sativus]KAJ4915926.1 Tubby-like protein 8 [Raphanus sativus]